MLQINCLDIQHLGYKVSNSQVLSLKNMGLIMIKGTLLMSLKDRNMIIPVGIGILGDQQ